MQHKLKHMLLGLKKKHKILISFKSTSSGLNLINLCESEISSKT